MKPAAIALLLGLLCALPSVHAQNTRPRFWAVDEIISGATFIRLKGDKGENLGILNRLHLEMVLDVKRRIEPHTRLRTDAWVTQSTEPVAFMIQNPQTKRFGVVLSVGMINLLNLEWDAYAAVLAHEYAHVVLNHTRDRTGAFATEDERSAERFAAQLLADAGYKAEGALKFWQKLREKSVSGPYLRTHPNTAERLEQLRQALEPR